MFRYHNFAIEECHDDFAILTYGTPECRVAAMYLVPIDDKYYLVPLSKDFFYKLKDEAIINIWSGIECFVASTGRTIAKKEFDD